MAKRSALRIGRRKRSHQLDQDETRIPISRETAEDHCSAKEPVSRTVRP
jgi:hypothetical protein